MMAPLCSVCESPTAYTLHFGGRCCKACAAFFRRTIALGLKYECSSTEPCEINFGMRLVCRECRLRKCFAANMKPDLVRSKKENFICTRRKDSRQSPMRNSMTPEVEKEDEWMCNLMEEKPVSSGSSSFDNGYCSPQPCSSSNSNFINQPVSLVELPPILNYYKSMECALSSRRRIMYTNTAMDYILDSHSNLECPYSLSDLRPHDYRTFRGMLRHDFVILFDYATRFPEFNTFTSNEKNMFYRLVLAVDFILSSAHYSIALGQAHRQMILPNGEYLCMDPLPISGQEPNAREYFTNDEDFSKYRALMPLNLAIWEETILPFSRLNISFEEFVLVKALTVWHVTYYKMTEEGRLKSQRQRNQIINCLSVLCDQNGGGERRVGEILMSMNYIMESVQKLTTNYVMLTFFDVLNCDSMLHEMLNFKY
ncbi:unnamed protein product [Caenorhabditis angaria]|uniref:Uncharacterized protein n=1 Tax=Caenorhabditis angaria TaxID=860376 RepID=A0A9P1N5B0_9PELO|nr:unnamed protein product [Caenorhabditis angaria]